MKKHFYSIIFILFLQFFFYTNVQSFPVKIYRRGLFGNSEPKAEVKLSKAEVQSHLDLEKGKLSQFQCENQQACVKKKVMKENGDKKGVQEAKKEIQSTQKNIDKTKKNIGHLTKIENNGGRITYRGSVFRGADKTISHSKPTKTGRSRWFK